jgi:adenylate kinase
MQIDVRVPQWLVITGQSGSGKGTAFNIINQWYLEKGFKVLPISTGDLIRAFVKKKTYLSKQMECINNDGLQQPPIVASSLWLNHLFRFLKKDQLILHEGSPRSVVELESMLSLVNVGYVDSIKVIEIQLPDEQCAKRLAQRTTIDKRLDLSKDGHPGTPDLAKIYTKLNWWTENRPPIITVAKEAGAYSCVENTGSIKDLKKKLGIQFTGMYKI